MDRRDTRNVILNALGEGLFGFKTWLVASGTVLTMLLNRHGAGERMIGLLMGVETVCCLFPSVLGMYLFRSRRRLRSQLIAWHVFAMLPFILLMGLLTFQSERMTPTVFRWALLGCWACFSLGIGVVLAAWMDFVAHLFHSGIRGTATGLASFCAAMAGTAAGPLAGRLIEAYPATSTFGWLYVAAWAVATAAMFLWLPVNDYNLKALPDVPPPPLRDLAADLAASLRDANYRSFLVGRMLGILGFCIGPFIALHYHSEAGGSLSEALVISCGAALTVGNAVGALLFGRIGDRVGHRAGVLLCMAVQVATLLTLLAGQGRWGCLLSFACFGLATAGGVPHNNLMLETCPHDRRMAHIVLSSLVLGTTLGLGALAGGFVARAAGLKGLFGLSLLFSLLALGWFGRRFQEPRRVARRPPPACGT